MRLKQRRIENCILAFRTQDQAFLFQEEIRGQLSDGHWEGAKPMNHWQPWCDAQVMVDPQPGRNFCADRTKYGLTSPDLLKVVGNRMIVLVKMAHKFGADQARFIATHLFSMVHEDHMSPNGYQEYRFTGIPSFRGEYWDDVRKKLANVNLVDVLTAIANDPYDKKALLKDLREMKLAMETYRTFVKTAGN